MIFFIVWMDCKFGIKQVPPLKFTSNFCKIIWQLFVKNEWQKQCFWGGGLHKTLPQKSPKIYKPHQVREFGGAFGEFMCSNANSNIRAPFECILLVKMHSNSNENAKLHHFDVWKHQNGVILHGGLNGANSNVFRSRSIEILPIWASFWTIFILNIFQL